MASKQYIEERIRELAVAIVAMEAEEDGDAWKAETIDDIENAMVWVGDLFAREYGVQRLARHTERPAEDEPCPHCGRASPRVDERCRQLVTRRGKVEVTEGKYRCRKCRRHFFPSHGAAGN